MPALFTRLSLGPNASWSSRKFGWLVMSCVVAANYITK